MKIDELIARSIIHANVTCVTCVPGFGGTQVFESHARIKGCLPDFSFHEEVAYASALGAAITGKYSAVLTKVHGLAKAANAVTDSLYMSPGGAMVLFVFEDKTGKHSDNIMEAEPLLRGLRIPCSKPGENEIAQSIYAAYAQSASLKTPVALIFDADMIDHEGTFVKNHNVFQPASFVRDLHAHLVVPVFADYQYKVLNAKLTGADYKKIERPPVPEIPAELPPDYAEYIRPYMPLMNTLRDFRGDIVFGDTGISTLFAFPPFHCVDVCSYMGGSVAMAAGACMAGYNNTWAITGDFSFIAAGHLGLIEAAAKNIPVKILIFKNNEARTTGSQSFDRQNLDRILEGYREYVINISSPDDETTTRALLQRAVNSEHIQIVVADYTRSAE
jgi:TPP-dependent indolepyruvate ferredoxin oxidoreductase alpha subunit